MFYEAIERLLLWDHDQHTLEQEEENECMNLACKRKPPVRDNTSYFLLGTDAPDGRQRLCTFTVIFFQKLLL